MPDTDGITGICSVRWLGILLLFLVLTPLLPSVVFAHAVFVSAQPAPGQRLVKAPTEVRIVFTEPLNGRLSGIEVLDSSAKAITPTRGGVDPSDPRAYYLSLPPMDADRYMVLWHTVSLVDGHAVRGSYSFTVLRPDGSEPAAVSAKVNVSRTLQIPAAADAGSKWLALLGFFLLSGAALVGAQGLAPLLAPEGPDAISRRLACGFSAMIAVGVAFLLLGSTGQLLDVWLPAGDWGAAGAVLLGRFGIFWLIRMTAGIALGVTIWPDSRSRQSRMMSLLAGLLTVLIGLSFSTTSHGATIVQAGWGTIFDLVHLLAAALWIGGVLALGLLFTLTRSGSDAERTCRRTALRRFSLVAGICVPAVLISGAGSALIELGSLRDLIATDYGRSLLIKSGVIIALLAVAAANAFRLRPAFQADAWAAGWLRQTVLAEGLLGLMVLIPAALMSVQVPARPQDQVKEVAQQLAANNNPANRFAGTTAIGNQAVDITLVPGTIGINQASIDLAGAVEPPNLKLLILDPSGNASSATLKWTGVERDESGAPSTVYQGALSLKGAPGTWRATIALPGGAGSSPPILIPLTPPEGASAGSSGPNTRWLVVIALALVGAVVAAGTRALCSRSARVLSLTLAGSGLAAALVVGATAVAPSGAVQNRTSWGAASRVEPRTAGTFQLWTMPASNAGLMIPSVGPDGSLWIGEMNTNRLVRLVPEGNQIQTFDYGAAYKGTMGTIVDPANQVWLAQGSAGAIGHFDPATGHYEEFPIPTATSDPTGIALDNAGDVWFTELGAGKIGRFDPKNHAFAEFPLPTPSGSPYWLAVAPDGRVWFTELAGAKVGVVDPASGQVTEYPTPNQEKPTGITVDDGGLVWAGTIEGSLIRLDPSTLAMTEFKAPGGLIYGVAVAPDGAIWVGTTGDTLYSFDPNAASFRAHRLPTDSGPWWPALAADGSVWVALGSPQGNALARSTAAKSATIGILMSPAPQTPIEPRVRSSPKP